MMSIAHPDSLKRLHWQMRRGLLENDLILSRFFSLYAAQLSEQDIDDLIHLLKQNDNDLLDILLKRKMPDSHLGSNIIHLLDKMQPPIQ